jgi:glycosyltransferase involved in cell wall biosynthesis
LPSKQEKKILVIDFCNYEDYPIGGYLSFAKNLLEAFENNLALVGITTNINDPIGKWFQKEINGCKYEYFAIARYNKLKTKNFIPDRLSAYLLLKYYRTNIFKIGIKNVFIQRQEILLAIPDPRNFNICYCFAGLENPLNISKYRYAGSFKKIFEKLFFKKLRYVKTILASGDENAIIKMVQRSKGKISRDQVIKFPTRINTEIFKPTQNAELRRKLNIDENATVIVTTGRLTQLKGWKFMIDCFIKFEKKIPGSIFYIIGEGEDLKKINDYISLNNLKAKVILTGKKRAEEIALYLNASNLFIMGSYEEGWSTSLSEAIACGVPSCVTDFSSANEIIYNGKNGYVIENHDSNVFVNKMLESIKISRPVFNEHVKEFASNKLKSQMLKNWELI